MGSCVGGKSLETKSPEVLLVFGKSGRKEVCKATCVARHVPSTATHSPWYPSPLGGVQNFSDVRAIDGTCYKNPSWVLGSVLSCHTKWDP